MRGCTVYGEGAADGRGLGCMDSNRFWTLLICCETESWAGMRTLLCGRQIWPNPIFAPSALRLEEGAKIVKCLLAPIVQCLSRQLHQPQGLTHAMILVP